MLWRGGLGVKLVERVGVWKRGTRGTTKARGRFHLIVVAVAVGHVVLIVIVQLAACKLQGGRRGYMALAKKARQGSKSQGRKPGDASEAGPCAETPARLDSGSQRTRMLVFFCIFSATWPSRPFSCSSLTCADGAMRRDGQDHAGCPEQEQRWRWAYLATDLPAAGHADEHVLNHGGLLRLDHLDAID